MCDFIKELNTNGIPLDVEEIESLVLKLNEEKNNIEITINKELKKPIDFMSLENLAFTLYENGYYPEELSYEYFKNNRNTNEVYNLMCQYKKILKNIGQDYCKIE